MMFFLSFLRESAEDSSPPFLVFSFVRFATSPLESLTQAISLSSLLIFARLFSRSFDLVFPELALMSLVLLPFTGAFPSVVASVATPSSSSSSKSLLGFPEEQVSEFEAKLKTSDDAVFILHPLLTFELSPLAVLVEFLFDPPLVLLLVFLWSPPPPPTSFLDCVLTTTALLDWFLLLLFCIMSRFIDLDCTLFSAELERARLRLSVE